MAGLFPMEHVQSAVEMGATNNHQQQVAKKDKLKLMDNALMLAINVKLGTPQQHAHHVMKDGNLPTELAHSIAEKIPQHQQDVISDK